LGEKREKPNKHFLRTSKARAERLNAGERKKKQPLKKFGPPIVKRESLKHKSSEEENCEGKDHSKGEVESQQLERNNLIKNKLKSNPEEGPDRVYSDASPS